MQYYLDLHEESSYYDRRASNEPPGQWEAWQCESFGLSGAVAREHFCKLLHAESPTTGEQLRQRRPNERPAFDLTFSAPKSVSVVYAFADQETKQAIEAAMYEAAREGLRYIQKEACYTRLGKDGIDAVRGEALVSALFLHTTSRAQDPQAHIHAVTFNFTRAPDGKFRTLEGTQLYQHKFAAGALFRVELAKQLIALGFEVEPDGFSFSITGVPPELCEELSKRSEQIRRELGDQEGTPEQRDLAALKSREPKRHVDPDKLFADWQEAANAYGFTAERVAELRAGVKPEDWNEAEQIRAAVRSALDVLTSSQSSFTQQEFVEQAAIQGQTRGVSANQLRLEVWRELELAMQQSPIAQLACLGQHPDGYERFTTKELHKLEQETLQAAERGRQNTDHCVHDASLAQAFAKKATLKTEQQDGTRHMTQGKGSVICVSGWAGTGKTFAVDAARIAWEAEGYKVFGCALSGKAASELSSGANIKAVTVAKLIYDLDHPARKDRLTLDSKTVLIVDEAGMVGTRALHRLVTEAERAGARLVLIGDENQLQSIDAGGGFSGLSKRLGYAELKEITRQRHPEDRRAVYDMATGNAAAALKSYDERQNLVLGEDMADAMLKLVADWQRDNIDLKEKLILSSTNHQAAVINTLCQQARQRQGELGDASVTIHDSAKAHVGDRVLFTRNDKRFGIHNGDIATVVQVTEKNESSPRATLTVKLDSGKFLAVPLTETDTDLRSKSRGEYRAHDIRLGYCVTTHKAQGATVDTAYVFAYGAMTSAEMAYVQVSRARNDTRIYTTKDEAGPGLSDLAEAMSRSRRKTLAHDMADAPGRRQHKARGMRHELCYQPM